MDKALDPALLIGRATYGRTEASDRLIAQLGPAAWLERQLNPSSIDDPQGLAVDAQWPRIRWSLAESHAKLAVGDWSVGTETAVHHLGRALFSSQELYEVMVDFWSNHLNVPCPHGDLWWSRHHYQAQVIRKHALGTFEDLFLASAFHPAMLRYLNGSDSTGQLPNENYARESLELHTVGVDAGYTEKDVAQAARLLTGWYLDEWPTATPDAVYDPGRHYTGSINAFGFTASNDDSAQGVALQRRYLSYLARHPKTARHIATKLATHFVSDTPPTSLIKKLAACYLQNQTAIVPVLRALFSSHAFAASAKQKIRRPMEQLIASFRAIGVTNGPTGDGLFDLYWLSTGDTGHKPLGWAMPNGYPDTADAWQSPASALTVFNLNASLAGGWWPNRLTLPQPIDLITDPPTDRSGLIDAVGLKLIGRKPAEHEHAAAEELLAATKLPLILSPKSWEQKQTVVLIATLFFAGAAHISI